MINFLFPNSVFQVGKILTCKNEDGEFEEIYVCKCVKAAGFMPHVTQCSNMTSLMNQTFQ